MIECTKTDCRYSSAFDGVCGLSHCAQAVEELYDKLLGQLELRGPNFEETPYRAAKLWCELLEPKGYRITTFPLTTKAGMVVVKNHECWSLCPHHLLPVRYICKIGYIPEKEVLGLSKLAWIADDLMRKLPLQEELPAMIGRQIEELLNPKGVGVIVRGEHLCMRMRGVESSTAEAVSSYMSGLFLIEEKARKEFMDL